MKNLSHLSTRIFDTPLMIEPRKLDVILHVLAPRLGIEAPEIDAALLEKQYSRKPYEVTSDGIAVINISGTLVNRSSGMDAFSGLTSYEELGNEILDAGTDDNIDSILLRIDSPGGEVAGVYDLADLIADVDKPVVASVDDAAFSAAYLLASAADKIYVTRTGGVGSIGVIATHFDQSKLNEKVGVKVTHIIAGKKKADFSPHSPLSDDVRSEIQAEIDKVYSMFIGTVANNRGMTEKAVRKTEAGLFWGGDAIAAGLADEIGTVRDALRYLTSSAAASAGTSTKEAKQMADTTLKADAGVTAPDLDKIRAEAEAKGFAQAGEIVELCALAGKPGEAAEFIKTRKSAADVRAVLLEARAKETDQQEISSHINPGASGEKSQTEADENALAERKRAQIAARKGGK